MIQKIKEKCATLHGKLSAVIDRAGKSLADERGDTNFISILIILGIVIILAGLFIGFKDQIVGQVKAIVDGFTIH